MQGFIQGLVVISDEEIEDGIAGAANHGFYDLLGVGREFCVANCDGIEGLEVVDDVEHAVLLLDAKPGGAVQGVRRLVHAGGDLLSKELDDLF